MFDLDPNMFYSSMMMYISAKEQCFHNEEERSFIETYTTGILYI